MPGVPSVGRGVSKSVGRVGRGVSGSVGLDRVSDAEPLGALAASAKGPVEAAKTNRGLWRNTSQLALVRWDESLPSSMDNLVLVNYSIADDHMERGVRATREAHPEESSFIDGRLASLRKHLGCCQ